MISTDRFDCSKVIISAGSTGLTGRQLYGILLERYHLQLEMAAGRYVLAMTSVGDTAEGMERLASALEEIDRTGREGRPVSALEEITRPDREGRQLSAVSEGIIGEEEISSAWKFGRMEERSGRNLGGSADMPCLPKPDVVYNSSDMEEMLEQIRGNQPAQAGKTEFLPWGDSVGYVAAEYAYLYPPGIPLIVPGERVSQQAADVLQWYYEMGFSIEGLKRELYIEILV